MKCGKCGFQAPENIKFCPKCGNSLKIICPRCKKEIPSGTKFCSGCGMTLQPPSTASSQGGQGRGNTHFQGSASSPGRKGPQSPKSPVFLILMILLVLLILGAAGGGIYYFLQDSGTEAEEHDRSKDDWDDEDEDDFADEDSGTMDGDDGYTGDDREGDSSEEGTDRTVPEGQESSQAGVPPTSGGGSAYETPGYEMPTAAQTEPGSSYTPIPTQPYTNEAMPQNPYGSSGDYILPDSAVRYLSSADLAGLSQDQLRLARNEIYARHGRMFTSEDLQNYFNSKSWYRGTISPNNFNGNVLNDYEKKNLILIQEEEKKFQ